MIRSSAASHVQKYILQIMIVKIVGNFLITAEKRKVNNFNSSVKSRYKLGTIAFEPGSFLFNGLQTIRDKGFTIRIHGDSKLESQRWFPI